MRGVLKSAVVGVPAITLVILGALLGMPFCASWGGASDVVTERVRRCPLALAALGDDPKPARLGVACGRTKNGDAKWQIPYTGTRARGTLSYTATKRASGWYLDRAILEVDGRAIDIVACTPETLAPGERIAPTNADAWRATLTGKVARSSHPEVAAGTACSAEIDRPRASDRAHLVVLCGREGRVLYDRSAVFALDIADAGRPDDDRLTLDGAEPRLRLDAVAGHGTLTITAAAWELVVEL